jgi:NAD(P)-dependent dehydrogenase (short-subunit alcohol dehydrogenase family)
MRRSISAAAHFGRLDILVNGAAHPGGLVRGTLDEADPEGLLEDIDIKVVGYMRCAKAAVPAHEERLGAASSTSAGSPAAAASSSRACATWPSAT